MSLDRSNLKKVVDAARLVRAADLRGSVERRPIASPPSPTVQFVTCTDATAGADGYFDGTLAFQDPDTGDWSDGDAVALDMPNDETPVVGTRYGCRFQGYATATGDAVYTAVGGAGGSFSGARYTYAGNDPFMNGPTPGRITWFGATKDYDTDGYVSGGPSAPYKWIIPFTGRYRISAHIMMQDGGVPSLAINKNGQMAALPNTWPLPIATVRTNGLDTSGFLYQSVVTHLSCDFSFTANDYFEFWYWGSKPLAADNVAHTAGATPANISFASVQFLG